MPRTTFPSANKGAPPVTFNASPSDMEQMPHTPSTYLKPSYLLLLFSSTMEKGYYGKLRISA